MTNDDRGVIYEHDIPGFEDVWDTDEDGNVEWVPYLLLHPPLPGYPGPVRYSEWPGVFKDGKQIGPAPLYGWVREEDPLAAISARKAGNCTAG